MANKCVVFARTGEMSTLVKAAFHSSFAVHHCGLSALGSIVSRASKVVWESMLAGGYWWLGGYVLAWYTPEPWPARIAVVCLAVGVCLVLIGDAFEEAGYKFPALVGCLLFAVPLTMLFVGGVAWGLSLVGLFRPFR